MTKRVSIFASYSNNNKINDYVIYYLQGLKEVCDVIIFVADCDIEEAEQKKLQGLVDHSICQRHGEYDFGSYKRGYNWAVHNNILDDADELILCNDSCYGPVYPFEQVFRTMEVKDCDYWGLVESHQIKLHLQSYFMVFKRNVFTSEVFKSFVKSFTHQDEFWDYIINYETRFVEVLSSGGFKHASFLDYKKYQALNKGVANDNPTFFEVTALKDGLPLIKRKMFGHEHRSLLKEPIANMLKIVQQTNNSLYNIMRADNNVVVLIPVYKSEMSVDEECSLKQCLKILSRYDIRLVCPEELDMSKYDEFIGYSIPKERFAGRFFRGIEGYNELMTDYDFYCRFRDYEYMLIYQLDAYVFSDQLLDWCKKGYDYIGAPWFEKLKTHEEGYKLWCCGNGGLSLRCIPKFIEVTKPEIMQKLKEENPYLWEDTLFSYGIKKSGYKMRRPSAEEAARFAFECSPSYLFQLTGNQLPFGCHAWRKYEFDEFWHKYIPAPPTVNVSIVTITYNNLEGLRQTANSILSQTFTRYEWIVIDGKSNDGTREYLEENSQYCSYWCSEKDEGVYDAQNKGIRHAKGGYIIFMNSGDTFYDEHVLENVFSKVRISDILYGNWTQVFDNGTTKAIQPEQNITYPWFYSNNICHQAMFIKTELLKNSPYDLSYRLYADWAKWAELSRQGKIFEYIPLNICYFKMGGISCKSESENLKEYKRICAEYYPGSLQKMAELYNPSMMIETTTNYSLKKRKKHLKTIRILIVVSSALLLLNIILGILLYVK